MKRANKLLEPPNGDWGWAVVFGSQLINMFNQSLLSVFGLMFGTYFSALNESEIRIALVMNLSTAFLNLTGLITGPLMKNFPPRIVAITGSLLVSTGLMLTSMTSTLNQVIFTYSFLVGIGLGLIGPSIFIAVSSYFTTKKARAFGFSMAGTGLGQMILPLIVRILLSLYGFRGTVLVMGSLSLHGVVGALLFQPVKWHMKQKSDNENVDEHTPLLSSSSTTSDSYKMSDHDEGFWKRIAQSMDLNLLKDFRFVLLNVGLACAYTVSTDFSLVLPFFLQDTANLSKSQTAVCMSVLAAFDLLSRLTFHFLTDKLGLSHRAIFMVGTLTLGIIRSILAELSSFSSLIIICGVFGYFRAMAVINQVLTISEFCNKYHPDKIPGALGLNMIIKGFTVLSVGQLLGWFRDLTQSYTLSLHSQNILLSIVMIIWTVELIWYRGI